MDSWQNPKDPDAVLDYRFDWAASTNGNGASDWLEAGETITSCTVTVPAGLTLDSFSLTNASTTVVAWLRGGTAGNEYDIACRITTSAGRTDDRTRRLYVAER